MTPLRTAVLVVLFSLAALSSVATLVDHTISARGCGRRGLGISSPLGVNSLPDSAIMGRSR